MPKNPLDRGHVWQKDPEASFGDFWVSELLTGAMLSSTSSRTYNKYIGLGLYASSPLRIFTFVYL